MKKITLGVIIGLSLGLGMSALAQFQTTTIPAVPAKTRYHFVKFLDLVAGDVISLQATGMTTQNYTVPAGKTAHVSFNIHLEVE